MQPPPPISPQTLEELDKLVILAQSTSKRLKELHEQHVYSANPHASLEASVRWAEAILGSSFPDRYCSPRPWGFRSCNDHEILDMDSRIIASVLMPDTKQKAADRTMIVNCVNAIFDSHIENPEALGSFIGWVDEIANDVTDQMIAKDPALFLIKWRELRRRFEMLEVKFPV